jgi:lysophospholipase L1-like esterase
VNVFWRIALCALVCAGSTGGCSSSTSPPSTDTGAGSTSASTPAGGSPNSGAASSSGPGGASGYGTGNSPGTASGSSSSGSSGNPSDGSGSSSSGGSGLSSDGNGSATSSGTGSSGSSGGGSSGSSSSADGSADSSTPADSGASSGGSSGPAAAGGGEAGLTDHTGVWRITPIGDSITEDTCGPQLLSQDLIKSGHTNFAFVGTETNNQACSGAPNVQSEGHGGYLVSDLLPAPHKATLQDHSAELPTWASSDKSDVLLMQFGTNDVWNGVPTQTILEAYTLVLTDYRAVNPGVILFVAQITPLNPAGCGTCEKDAEALNAAIPAWATSQATAHSPIYVVDVWSAFTASAYVPNSTYTADGVHPNPAGAALVAQKWYGALIAQGSP